ncbi:MAG: RNA polymerase sigma factor [Caldilineaceae bacterium]
MLQRGGNEATWAALVQAHQAAVFRLAYLLLGDADEAEDVAQEAFIRAFYALARFDPARPLRPWLLQIARNLAYNRRRSLRRYLAALGRWWEATSSQVEAPSVTVLQGTRGADSMASCAAATGARSRGDLRTLLLSAIRRRYGSGLGRSRGYREITVIASLVTVAYRGGTGISRLAKGGRGMKQPVEPRWEEQIRAVARTFPYPPTPDLADAVQQRLAHRAALPRPGWTVTASLGVSVGVDHPVDWLIGSPNGAGGTAGMAAISRRPHLAGRTNAQPDQRTAAHTDALASLFDLAGATTPAAAQQQAGFPLRLPTYPANLGAPDQVFVQQTNGWFVVLLWMEPTDPQQVRLVLYEVGPGVGLEKGMPTTLRETLVKGQAAIWIEGTHYLKQVSGDWAIVRFIDQEVLVWREVIGGQEITYRLETALPEAQALTIAESLR